MEQKGKIDSKVYNITLCLWYLLGESGLDNLSYSNGIIVRRSDREPVPKVLYPSLMHGAERNGDGEKKYFPLNLYKNL